MPSTQEKSNKIEFDLKDYLEKNFGEIRGEFKEVRREIKQVDENLRNEIKQVDENLRNEIKRVDSKIDKVDGKVDKLMDNHLKHLQRYVFFGVSMIIGLLIKIAFFNQ